MLIYDKAQKQFLDYIQSDREQTGYLHYRKLLQEYKKIYNEPMPSIYQPVIVSKETGQALISQSEQIAGLLQKASSLYLMNRDVQNFFNFPDELHGMITHHPGYEAFIPVSRYDGIWDGRLFRFCEFNTDGSSGIDDADFLTENFLKTGPGEHLSRNLGLKQFCIKENLLEVILDSYREFGGHRKPNIAIVDFMESATKYEFEAIRKYFMSKGYATEICEIRKLKLKSDGLWHDNFRIDVVYRRALTDEMFLNRKDIRDFLCAYTTNAVCVVGSLRSHIAHSKLMLAFLHSDMAAGYFSGSELELIERLIPWTAKVESSDSRLERYILDNREKLFVKPHNSKASKGVYCGADIPDDKWKNLIESKVMKSDSYLVQERIEVPPEEFVFNGSGSIGKYYVNMGPYLFDGKFGGMYIRGDKGRISKQSFMMPFNIACL